MKLFLIRVKSMKKLLLASLCLTALVGCGGDKTASEPKAESAPTASGEKVYIALTYPEYAPYQYLDEKGDIVGFDVDMIHAIAESQNFKVKVQTAHWVGMLEELNKGGGDLVISGISRQQAGGDSKYALSNAYLHGRDAILTKEGTTNINTMADMVINKMGVQSDTIFAHELTQRKGNNSPTLKQTKTSFTAFQDLVHGHVDGVYAHENILRHYAKGQPQLKFRFSGTGEGFDYYDMVVVTKKGNDELMQKINAGIAEVHANGTYQKLHVKWFGVEPPKPTK